MWVAFCPLLLRTDKIPPKKNTNQPDEVEGIKKSLDSLSVEMKKASVQKKKITDLMGEIHTLKIQNMEKDQKITLLENQVDDLGQFSSMNNLLISDLRN